MGEFPLAKSKQFPLPNVRKFFIPDPGMVILEADLKGADAQVVAWEAEDEDLKRAFRAGLDVHSKNAEDVLGTRFTLINDPEAKARVRKQYKFAIHGTNYGGSPPAIAAAAGWTVHEADTFQKRWFSIHPKIKDWHTRVQHNLLTKREVRNVYGYRRHYFDRVDDLLPEALAWGPQSTVAIACFDGMLQLESRFPWVELLLQVHDSVVFQIPEAQLTLLPQIGEALQTVTPFEDPLTIPWDIAGSRVSWGDKEKLAA
jgi:DNA polymerase-1